MDESFTDRQLLVMVIANRPCSPVNLRISKCAALVATLARATEALSAGLQVQIGYQVDESSFLSTAQLISSSCVSTVVYAEEC